MRAENQMATPAAGAGTKKTLVELLIQRAQEAGTKTAATHKKDGKWQDVTWGQILQEVKTLSAALVAQGVKPGDRVAIFANTSLQWLTCDLAVSAAQAVTVPIYSSNTPDECRYILNHSESMLLFVDNDEKDAKQAGRLTRIRQRLADCPSVQKIVVFEGATSGDKEMSLTSLMEKGREAEKQGSSAFEERAKALKLDDTWGFIYTSGTTGDPKGVILTHDNWAYQAHAQQSAGLM
jgi:long-chain acyl-CoA synthetase